MPIIRSAKKKLKQDKKRRLVNIIQKDAAKDAIRAFKKKPTDSLFQKVASEIDKSVKKNILHKNKAARVKSRLSRLLKKKKS